jgi:hypothetical protein
MIKPPCRNCQLKRHNDCLGQDCGCLDPFHAQRDLEMERSLNDSKKEKVMKAKRRSREGN